MAKRTFTKMTRKYDLIKNEAGHLVPILRTKEDGLRPADPRMSYDVDCGDAGKVTVLVAPGQRINPYKICKRHKEGLDKNDATI